MIEMTDERAADVLAAMRQDGGTVDDADWIAAIDHAVSRLRSQPPAEAQPVGGGEVFGWALGDAFVDARFWTAGTPPRGWTPVYRTAPPSTPVGVEWLSELSDDELRIIFYADPKLVRRLKAAFAQQPAAVDEGWRQKAAEWLEAKAVEQEANNQRWPDHAAAYKEWRDRPDVLRCLAAQVIDTQQGGSSDG